MKLNTLILNNFKGCRSFTLEAGGEDLIVYGDNEVGKTTLFDAFMWLLFDKDSNNRKDFPVKTLIENGEPAHGLEHSVEAALEVEGRELTLKKVYAEKWTKKRGSAEKQFSGHTVDHFIDGVPAKKGEYDAKIGEIADEDTFKLLTNPKYFNEQLHWQKRREILLQVCGDVTDQEVIGSNNKLEKLPEILGNRKLEDHRKVVQGRRTEINKELDKIPVRIDEVSQGLPDISGFDKQQIEKETAKLKELIQNKEQQVSRIEGGGEAAEKTKRLREVEAELFEIKNNYHTAYGKKIQELQKKLYGAKDRRSEISMAAENAEKVVKYNQRSVEDIEAKIAQKRVEWHEIIEAELEHTQGKTCPACGQELPAEKLQGAREKDLSDFNERKAKRLEEVSGEGKRFKEQKDGLEIEIKEKQGKLEEAKHGLEAIDKEVEEINSEFELVKATAEEYAQDPAYREKEAEIEQVLSAIQELKEGNLQEAENVRSEIAALRETAREMEAQLQQVENHEKGQQRIKELKAQEKKLAAEYEKLEQELYLTEEFIRSKVELLEGKINSRFRYARVKLFDTFISGGVEETCETIYEGVPYNSGLNNGHKFIVGLDIIGTLSEHYSFYPPIWVDNAEAITRLPEMQAQVIKLVVSEPDKNLRVESATKTKEAV